MYDLAVIIARMQPVHIEHEGLIRAALSKAHKVLILLGSENEAPSLRNPFSLSQRKHMLSLVLEQEISREQLVLKGLRDMSYQQDMWVEQVNKKLEGEKNILFVCGSREDSAHLQNDFKQHDFYVHPVTTEISGTKLREAIFEDKPLTDCSRAVANFIDAWTTQPINQDLFKEYLAARTYQESWANSPFPPIFMAADNVVNWRDNILLIERKSQFGGGKWALPGGYVESHQTLKEAAKAELYEETGLVIPHFGGNPEVIDAINRSAQGRMLTSVFFNTAVSEEIPQVIAGDDAARAFWCPLETIKRNQHRFFSDHFHIIAIKYPEIYNV